MIIVPYLSLSILACVCYIPYPFAPILYLSFSCFRCCQSRNPEICMTDIHRILSIRQRSGGSPDFGVCARRKIVFCGGEVRLVLNQLKPIICITYIRRISTGYSPSTEYPAAIRLPDFEVCAQKNRFLWRGMIILESADPTTSFDWVAESSTASTAAQSFNFLYSVQKNSLEEKYTRIF